MEPVGTELQQYSKWWRADCGPNADKMAQNGPQLRVQIWDSSELLQLRLHFCEEVPALAHDQVLSIIQRSAKPASFLKHMLPGP